MSKLPKTLIRNFEDRREQWGLPAYRDAWSLKGLTKRQRKRYVVEDDNTHSCSICAHLHPAARRHHELVLEEYDIHRNLEDLMSSERNLKYTDYRGREFDKRMASFRGRG